MDLSKLDRREPWKESFAAQAGSDALFELDAVGCFLIDDDGVIRRINRAAAKLLGDRTDSFVGERLAYFISRRSRPVPAARGWVPIRPRRQIATAIATSTAT